MAVHRALPPRRPVSDRTTGVTPSTKRRGRRTGPATPANSHYNEQVTYILDGALKFWIDGKEIVVHAGEVLCIPAHMPHKAEALEDTVDLDVFTPPRADWINRTDQYLRNEK